MSRDQVLALSRLLAAESIDHWLVGGWGVDALLGVQTRLRKDLDLLIRLEDVVKMMRLVQKHGFTLAYEWPESRRLVGDSTPTAFVMTHADGRELDLHAVSFAADGTPHPEWRTDWDLVAADLTGAGSVGGVDVRCTTADRQLRDHASYEMPPDHARDMELLRKTFPT
jgi:lincosamide nucleotidyltransferase A/C/D/E